MTKFKAYYSLNKLLSYLISVLSIVPPDVDTPEVIVLWLLWQQNLKLRF